MKTRIIIFAAKEQQRFVEELQSRFYHDQYSVEVWTDGFFTLSKSYIENFSNLKLYYDFAVVLLSGDDLVYQRGKKIPVARDNVILELGMCIEAFSMSKTIIIQEQVVQMPSDLLGVQTISYSLAERDSLGAVTGAIAAKIKSHIEKFIQNDTLLSWNELLYHTKRLVNELRKSEGIGGFHFDIIVGINRGGLIISELIAREFGHNMPVLALFADRSQGRPVFDSKHFIVDNSYILGMLEKESIKSILLVDSFMRSGNSIAKAKQYLTKKLPSKRIKTAVIYVNETLETTDVMEAIDYYVCFKNLHNKSLSLDHYVGSDTNVHSLA